MSAEAVSSEYLSQQEEAYLDNPNAAMRLDESGNVSSSTEGVRQRTKRRKEEWRKSSISSAEQLKKTLPPPLNTAGPESQTPIQVAVKSLEELLQHFPHLDEPNVVLKQTTQASAASGCNKTKMTFVAGSGMTTAAEICASSDSLLKAYEESLVRPIFYTQASHGERLDSAKLVAGLLNRELSLPRLTADYMSDLMQEAGSFEHPKLPAGVKRSFPSCKNKKDCIGSQEFFLWRPHSATKKIVFTALMFPGEYESFLREGLLPTSEKPCIACCIHSLTKMVLGSRIRRINCIEDPVPRSSSSSSSAELPSVIGPVDPSIVFGRAAPVRRIDQLFYNPVDCEGGFYSKFCLTDPDATDIFIDPIVLLNQSRVHLEIGPLGGRARLNIDALRYRSMILPPMWVGQGAAAYSRAVENMLTTEKHIVDAAVRKAQVRYAFPFPHTQKLVFSGLTHEVYDLRLLQDCKEAMRDDGLLRTTSLAAAMLHDAARLGTGEDGWIHAVASPWHIPVMQKKMFSVAFCAPMDQSDPIIYLLSKTVSQRCNTRKFGIVAMRQFKEVPSSKLVVKALVLVSLLGNYMHSRPSSRPNPDVRARLYKLLMDEPANAKEADETESWFKTFTLKCPYAMEFCLRDQLVYQMKDNMAMAEHVGVMMPLDKYYEIVEQACCRMRQALSVLVYLKTGTLRTMASLEAEMKRFHTTLLAISYRLPKPLNEIISKLVSARDPLKENGVPVSVTPSNHNKQKAVSAAATANEECDEAIRAIYKELRGLEHFFEVKESSRTENGEEGEDGAESAEEWNGSNSVLPAAKEMLGTECFDTLKWLVHRIAPTRRDCLQVLISLMPRFCGVKTKSASLIYNTIEEFRVGCINAQALPVFLASIKRKDGFAYDVLQVTIDLIHKYSRIRLIRKLPVHITNAQLRASQDAFVQLQGSAFGLYDGNEFVWCSVCGGLYSMARAPKNRGSKKLYQYGLRDVVVDYDTDYLYCWDKRASHLPECANVPLLRMSMFGVLIGYDKKQYMLCPQPGCGMPMVLDTSSCKFTEYGPVCCLCAKKMPSAASIERDRLKTLLRNPDDKCAVCCVSLKNLSNKFYYADGVYVCHRHNHFAAYTAAILATGLSHIEPDETKKLLIRVHQSIKSERAEKQRFTWKKQLAISKMNRCSKSKR